MPVVVEKIVVNGPVAAGAVWIWNAVANAASQVSRTWQTVAVAPRSTCSHCGSLNADDQRVPVLPSKAALRRGAGVLGRGGGGRVVQRRVGGPAGRAPNVPKTWNSQSE